MHKVWREELRKAEHLDAVEQETADVAPGRAHPLEIWVVPPNDRVTSVEVEPVEELGECQQRMHRILVHYRALESLVHVGLVTVFTGSCGQSILLAWAGWPL